MVAFCRHGDQINLFRSGQNGANWIAGLQCDGNNPAVFDNLRLSFSDVHQLNCSVQFIHCSNEPADDAEDIRRRRVIDGHQNA
jgi:hypothetical protein